MRATYIDEDTARAISTNLDYLKIYKLAQERGNPGQVRATLSLDEGDYYYNALELVEHNSEFVFGTSCVDICEPNYPEDEYYKFFKEMADYYDHDNGYMVTGVFIKHPDIMRVLNIMYDNDINIKRTPLFSAIDSADDEVARVRSYDSYCEFFLPVWDKEMCLSTGVCFLFIDPTLFNSQCVIHYYDALDYCKNFLNNIPLSIELAIKEAGLNEETNSRNSH